MACTISRSCFVRNGRRLRPKESSVHSSEDDADPMGHAIARQGDARWVPRQRHAVELDVSNAAADAVAPRGAAFGAAPGAQ
jgi:hypothetical protein